jgi:hypothetical protein
MRPLKKLHLIPEVQFRTRAIMCFIQASLTAPVIITRSAKYFLHQFQYLPQPLEVQSLIQVSLSATVVFSRSVEYVLHPPSFEQNC